MCSMKRHKNVSVFLFINQVDKKIKLSEKPKQ